MAPVAERAPSCRRTARTPVLLTNLRFCRSVDLHVFIDASEKAFAAVTYLRVRAEEGPAPVAFVAAKARVAPLKPLSIPRLELQAAVLGTRQADTIRAQTAVIISSTTFWSDSRTVLLWVKSDARRYKSFVAHRIGEIVEIVVICFIVLNL